MNIQYSKLLRSFIIACFVWSMIGLLYGSVAMADNKEVPAFERALQTHEKRQGILPLPVELVEEVDEFVEDEADVENIRTIEPSDVLAMEGTAPILAESSESNAAALSDTKTTILNVNDVDIATLVKTFSKLTGRNYIVDDGVKGKITIHLPTAVTIEEALRIFDTVLLLKGFTTVPVTDNLWKVIRSKDAKQTTIPIISKSPDIASDVLVTQIIHFKHVKAEEIQQIVQPFISADGTVTSYTGTNALIVIDSALNIKRIMGLIQDLDVPASDQEITIIPILHADAQGIADKINEIMGEQGGATGGSGGSATNAQQQIRMPNAAQRTAGSAGGTVQHRSLPIKIIPDERTNSLIVVADEENTAKVQGLVEQLDSPMDRSSGRFFVYRLQHAGAESIAEILTNLISGASDSSKSGSGGTGTTGEPRSGSSISRSRGSQTPTSAAAGSQNSLTSRLANALQQRRAATGTSNTPGGKVNFEGEITITADKSTNSLIINASRSDYEKIKEVLDVIDVQRRQILVEATILEISLNKDEGMGVELQGTAAGDSAGVFAQTNYGGLTNVLTNPSALSDLTIAAASSGTVTLPGGITIPSQAVLISAVSSNENVNVLSSPTIVTTDNEEAEIIVGENVPFVTSTSTDTANINNTFNQIERQDVGITLRITPQVSASDSINLKIFVEISNVVSGTRNDPNGPSTTIRTTETTVEVKNGQMIVTGGLISDSLSEATRGIPFLQDIPVLGHLFSRSDLNRRRTNLLIFITPRIMKNSFDAREEAKSFSRTMEEFITEQNAQPSREEVLRNERLDAVVERIGPNTPLPTRITPPTESKQYEDVNAAAESLRALEKNQALSAATSKLQPEVEETIAITAKPKVPEKPILPEPTEVPKEESNNAPEASTAAEAIMPPTIVKKSSEQYVVLRDITESPLPKSQAIPFQYSSDDGALGLVVPRESPESAQDFFKAGKRFSFSNGGETRSFVCLGVYKSPEEAASAHTEFQGASQWYKMSEQELTNLGKQFWSADS